MNIFCVGRNYAAHAQELGNATPEQPVIFMKPETSLVAGDRDFRLPGFSSDIHYECEVVFRIARAFSVGACTKFEAAMIDGVGLGVDFTARDVQSKLKAKGLPWELAKSFEGSASVSEFRAASGFGDFRDISFELKVNGESRQRGNTHEMIFGLDALVPFINRYFALRVGDLIYSGTPPGVGPLRAGDRVEGWLRGERVFGFGVL